MRRVLVYTLGSSTLPATHVMASTLQRDGSDSASSSARASSTPTSVSTISSSSVIALSWGVRLGSHGSQQR
uniref:Putative secreted protein n=1 Tax=Ixodes ricinus TaxID=34613 RepID=A0A6B0U1S7_IXORI